MRMWASPSVGWPCLCWLALCWLALCWQASLAGLLAGGRVTRRRWGGASPGYPPVERGRWRGLSTVYGVDWLQRSGGGGKRDREGLAHVAARDEVAEAVMRAAAGAEVRLALGLDVEPALWSRVCCGGHCVL